MREGPTGAALTGRFTLSWVLAFAAGTAWGLLPLLSGGTALIDTTYVENAASGIVAALHRADHARGNAYAYFMVTRYPPFTFG